MCSHTIKLKPLVSNQTRHHSGLRPCPSPLHPTVYVDNIAKSLPQGTKHSLYADDLAIWSYSPDLLKATHTVQKTHDHLKEWSLKWCLPVNPAKCKCCFFSTDPHQASHQPQLTLTGTSLYNWGPSEESLSQLYKAFIRPIFSYASPG